MHVSKIVSKLDCANRPDLQLKAKLNCEERSST